MRVTEHHFSELLREPKAVIRDLDNKIQLSSHLHDLRPPLLPPARGKYIRPVPIIHGKTPSENPMATSPVLNGTSPRGVQIWLRNQRIG